MEDKGLFPVGCVSPSIRMKRSLMEMLACPRCKYHPLDLSVKKEERNEVIEGTITCPKCKTNYPIEDGIPNMLIPEQ